jgi:hypothetical protein
MGNTVAATAAVALALLRAMMRHRGLLVDESFSVDVLVAVQGCRGGV